MRRRGRSQSIISVKFVVVVVVTVLLEEDAEFDAVGHLVHGEVALVVDGGEEPGLHGTPVHCVHALSAATTTTSDTTAGATSSTRQETVREAVQGINETDDCRPL